MDLNDKPKKSLTYSKQLKCPVCGNDFSVPVVKSRVARIKKRDTDFFVEYDFINPYFYDIWLCPKCGYAAQKNDFENIKSVSADTLKQKIQKGWTERKYPDEYDVDIAIERYKIALMNYCVIGSKDSQKGYICLKLSWMYRIKGKVEEEMNFTKSALECFESAYMKENLPFCGMNKAMIEYLIGELYRRIGKTDEALRWFSEVIVSRDAEYTIKEKARDQKDIIMEQRRLEA